MFTGRAERAESEVGAGAWILARTYGRSDSEHTFWPRGGWSARQLSSCLVPEDLFHSGMVQATGEGAHGVSASTGPGELELERVGLFEQF